MTCALPTSLPLRECIRDGVRLCFHDSGPHAADSPPILFIHGNSCDSGFFAPLVARFGAERRVIAVDLRGHGASDAPVQEYDIALFASDCAWLLDALETPPCLLVGHSMGGAVAVEHALRRPDQVRAVAALDSTLIPDHAALQAVLPPMIQAMKGPDYLNAFYRFVDGLFLPPEKALCDEGFKEAIWDRMRRTPHHVMVSLMELLLHYEAEEIESLHGPMLYVGGEHWRTDPAALRSRCPAVQLEHIGGAGHFLMLETPDRIIDLLEKFFERVGE